MTGKGDSVTAYSAWSVVFGEQPSAAKWNILGTNDSSFNDGTGVANLTIGATTAVALSYKFHVYRSAALTLAGSGSNPTTITYDTKVFDTGSNVDIVTNKGRFTAPIAGFYQFEMQANVACADADAHYFSVYKNGSDHKHISGPIAGATTNMQYHGGAFIQLASSDYVEIKFINSNAGTRTLNVGILDTWFTGYLVSAT